jgi:hypothetical protein
VAVALHEVGGVDARATYRDDDVEGSGTGRLSFVDFEVPLGDDNTAHPSSLRRVTRDDRPLESRHDYL